MNNLDILIIEDESLLALELATIIGSYGYRVVAYVTNAKQAKEVLSLNDINLIIMDINLNEEIDGIDLYKSFHTEAEVIYLTAYVDEQTITKAVETTPLGYLIKPHNQNELLALLKLAEHKLRSKNQQETAIELLNDYKFDMKTNMLIHHNNSLKLSSKKAELLKLLIQAKGELISFERIENIIYRDNTHSESTLRTLIYRLRKELPENMIETELNYGIRLKTS